MGPNLTHICRKNEKNKGRNRKPKQENQGKIRLGNLTGP